MTSVDSISTNFDPVSSTLGGAIIGASAGTLWLLQGRVLGVSGILGGCLQNKPASAWRRAFIAGLLLGGFSLQKIYPSALNFFESFQTFPSLHPQLALFLQGFAGVLVGFGTQISNGCTSGHGVTGLARFSPRSLCATLSFMVAGAFAAYLTRHYIQLYPVQFALAPYHPSSIGDLATPLKVVVASFSAIASVYAGRNLIPRSLVEQAPAFLLGATFSIGLGLSGMTHPSKVLNFLDFAGVWDPSLMCVMGGALIVNGLIHLASKKLMPAPILGTYSEEPQNAFPPRPEGITFRLVAGAVLFGLGWGIAGVCPGPGIVSSTTLLSFSNNAIGSVGVFLGGLVLGTLSAAKF